MWLLYFIGLNRLGHELKTILFPVVYRIPVIIPIRSGVVPGQR